MLMQKGMCRNKKGYVLVEIIVATLLAGLLFMVLSVALRSVLIGEKLASKYNFGAVSSLFEDMSYSISLAKTVAVSSNLLTVERVDGCIVSYVYDPNRKIIEKTISGSCNNEKKLILDNVDGFSVSASGTDTYDVTISTNGESNTITVRKM